MPRPFPALLASALAFLSPASLRSADFPEPPDTESNLGGFLTPQDALKQIRLPPGFHATLFAAEPDVRNPIAMAWDARGRLWIAECYTYAESAFDPTLRDRILIFEDSDGDGHFDSRTVFTDELQKVTGIEVGLGGLWVTAAPHLLFIPDADGDDKPDAAPDVRLDGFHVPPENHHNLVNGIRFGPDGWLYGRCGATGSADVGVPGTPAQDRVPIRGGIWRYHPKLRIVEAITSGNTNPWGHDWNEHGELFYVNTVNAHFWHAIPGAHFVRSHTLDPNPHTYTLIGSHADHWHFDTALGWQDNARRKDRNASDALGGGHVHTGAMFYLADNWPADFRGQFFTLNQHGRRANREHVERLGSGYVARHRPDFFTSADPWFIGLDLTYGPDGGVFVIDWSDTGECHDHDGVHRSSGRIFKITHGKPKPAHPDLRKLNPGSLVALHSHPNEWFVRQARLELAARTDTGDARTQLRSLVTAPSDPVLVLRALWSLHAVGGTDPAFLKSLLSHESEYVRAWALRLLTDLWPMDTLMSARPARFGEINSPTPPISPASLLPDLQRLSTEDPSALVRLTLASILQRLPADLRTAAAAGLASHAADAADHNLPHMLWYGLIPVAETDPASLASLATSCALPLTRQSIARRLAEDIDTRPAPLDFLLSAAAANPDPAFRSDVLSGIAAALTGWHKAKKPASWDPFAASLAHDPHLAPTLRDLATLFGDGRALDEVKRIALDSAAPLPQRQAALKTLIANRPPDLRPICEQLLKVRFLNPTAAAGLAQFDDPDAARLLVNSYRAFHHTERHLLLDTLTSRPSFAHALLAAARSGTIPLRAISPLHARHIRNLGDPDLTRSLAEVWGDSRTSPADKSARIDSLKADLTPEILARADKSRGRQTFAAACATCHRLHGEGRDLGPDLTGAGRDSIHYLLENIVDPAAQVPADFRLSVLTLKDGRTLSGIVASRGPRTLSLLTMAETLTLELDQISHADILPASLMPDGLLDTLTPDQIRDLIAYLTHPSQVPLPGTP